MCAEIRCSECDLLLGEAAVPVEITCPNCVELGQYMHYLLMEGEAPQQKQWDIDVHQNHNQMSAIIMDMLEKRTVAIF